MDSTVDVSPAAEPTSARRPASRAREIIARYPAGRERSALLPLLHLVQSEEGYVTPDGVAFCAEQLGLTKAEVGAVATFYTMYKRRPTGEYLVSVCTNTLCDVLGGGEIFRRAVRAPRRRPRRDDRRRHDHPGARRVPGRLRLRPGGDGQLRVLRQPDARVGAASWSPSCGPASGRRPTRGARLCTLQARWRCSSPGFADDRDGAVADGRGRATPTLRGTRLAEQQRHHRAALRRRTRRSRRRRPRRDRNDRAIGRGAGEADARCSPSAGCRRTPGRSTTYEQLDGYRRCARRWRRTRTT